MEEEEAEYGRTSAAGETELHAAGRDDREREGLGCLLV